MAAPQATFGRKSVYADLAEVAAAHLFYLRRNHPFVHGNKQLGSQSYTPAAGVGTYTYQFCIVDVYSNYKKEQKRSKRGQVA